MPWRGGCAVAVGIVGHGLRQVKPTAHTARAIAAVLKTEHARTAGDPPPFTLPELTTMVAVGIPRMQDPAAVKLLWIGP